MRKKIITMLILSTVAFTACSNDSNSKQTDIVVPTTTTTATITTATTEQETVAEYVFFENTDVPQCEKMLNVKYAFMTVGDWKEDKNVTYSFVSKKDKSEVEAINPDFNEYIDIQKSVNLYDDYLKDKGYSFKKGKNKDNLTKYTYIKDNIKITLEFDDSTLQFTIVDTKNSTFEVK